MSLALEGKILIVERNSKGRIIDEQEIDPEPCLKLLINALESGIGLLEKKMASKFDLKENLNDA